LDREGLGILKRENYSKPGNGMSIKTISRSQFAQLLPCPFVLENLMVEQVGWFSNRSGNMLGTIANGAGVAGWNYVILKREKEGGFHIRKVMGNFFNLNAAKIDLLLSMKEIGKFDCAKHDSANSWLPSFGISRLIKPRATGMRFTQILQ
jgi:hypothetical protein